MSGPNTSKVEHLSDTLFTGSVSSVIVHDVGIKYQSEYEEKIKLLKHKLHLQTGFQSIDIIRPYNVSTRYVIILRFDTVRNSELWFDSDQRKNIIHDIKPWLIHDDYYNIQSSQDFWFDLSSKKPPKKWKQFIVSWLAVLPLAMTVPILYIWFFTNFLKFPRLLVGVPISLTISFFMTYVLMPYLLKKTSTWLSE